MHFINQYQNCISNKLIPIKKIRGHASGQATVSGTLTPVFKLQHMWGVVNAKATTSLKNNMLISGASTDGKATVSGNLTAQ